jgi:hypothetical protein
VSLAERWRRWTQLIGPAETPDTLPVLPLDLLSRGVPQTTTVAGQRVHAFIGGYIVDPPAGGFAANDSLIVIPQDDPDTVVNAVRGTAYENSRLFEAGVWDLFLDVSVTAGLASGERYKLQLIAGETWPGGVAPLPSFISGLSTGWSINGIGVAHVKQMHLRFYAPVAWNLRLMAQSAVTDTDVLGLNVAASLVRPVEHTRVQ